MGDYYAQRASEDGLIISETTPISRQSYGYAGAPGIYDDAQIEGWRAITNAVHAAGGRIVTQLWHVGRQSHPDIQPNGEAPGTPSAIAAEGYGYAAHGPVPFSMPPALEQHEIPQIVGQFRAGAARAREAGFDVVEIHRANGYLPTNSCRTRPTTGPTTMAARSRTAPAFCWRSPRRPSTSGARTGSACG